MRRPHTLASTLLAAVVLAGLAQPAAADARADEVFWRINEARAERGLAPLARWAGNGQVVAANDDLAATRDAHRLSDQNWGYYANNGANGYGENQAWGSPDMSAARAVQAWSESPGHARNMFNPNATHLAVASTTSSGTRFYTSHLITAPAVDASDPGPQPPGSSSGSQVVEEAASAPSSQNDTDDAGSADPSSESGSRPSADAEQEVAAPAEPATTSEQGDEPTSDAQPQEQEPPAQEPGPTWQPEPLDEDTLIALNEIDMAPAAEPEPEADIEEQLTAPTDLDDVRADSDAMAVEFGSQPGGPGSSTALLPLALVLGAATILASVVVGTRSRYAPSARSGGSRPARRAARTPRHPTARAAAAAPTSAPTMTSDNQWTRR